MAHEMLGASVDLECPYNLPAQDEIIIVNDNSPAMQITIKKHSPCISEECSC
jgi:hypothetical protein